MSSLVIKIVDDAELEAVALASDGLDRAAVVRQGDQARPHAPFLNPLLDQAADRGSSTKLAAYLLADESLSDTTDDDRTLLMAVRR